MHEKNSQQNCAGVELSEIPAQIENINLEQSQLSDLLCSLHRRLEAILPPSCPTVQLLGISKNPDSPLGQQLNSICTIARQNADSVRDLLDRIKL